MHPYLTHLLEDIEKAKRPGFPDNNPYFSNYEPEEGNNPEVDSWEDETESDDSDTGNLPESEEKDFIPLDDDFEYADAEDEDLDETFAEVEQYVSGHPPPACFGDYCGLKVADFPPTEQLTEDDMIAVIRAYRKMGATWNIDFAFPENLPTVLHYNILVNTLNEKIMIMKNGFTGFDYCGGNPEGCIFGEYCGCLEYWREADSEKS
jgi:hypothetical protein